MKKALSVFLCFVMLITFGFPAFADESTIQPRFSDIGVFVCDITKNLITYKVYASVLAKDPDNTVSMTVTLQESTPAWSDTSHVWSVSNRTGAVLEKNVILGSGVYRLKLDITILSPSGSVLETETVYSASYAL